MAGVESEDFGKLRWRCRRGIKELDVLLTRYADEQYRDAPAPDQEAFRGLLDVQDCLIYDYCFGQRRAPTAELSALIERITAGAADATGAGEGTKSGGGPRRPTAPGRPTGHNY